MSKGFCIQVSQDRDGTYRCIENFSSPEEAYKAVLSLPPGVPEELRGYWFGLTKEARAEALLESPAPKVPLPVAPPVKQADFCPPNVLVNEAEMLADAQRVFDDVPHERCDDL